MKRFSKLVLAIILIVVLTAFWYWIDSKDYFQTNYSYNDLTETQQAFFRWHNGDGSEKLQERFRQHFFDPEFYFPRQKVVKVKLFRNIPMFGILTGKTLKQNQVDSFIKFCNDSANYLWGETTWALSESEYYFKLYNSDDQVAGKIYFCLDDCFMTSARPFCPAMKFGMLSPKGFDHITTLINSKDNWE